MSEVSDGGIGGPTDFGGPDTEAMGGRASEMAHDAMGKAADVAREVRDRAADQVEGRISEQQHRAAGTLESVAQSLRTASEQLPEHDGVSRYMARAAGQVDNIASFLNNREVSELFDEVEGFARRQPAAFVGGAFALGVLGARFLKSSRRTAGDKHESDWNRSSAMDEMRYEERDTVSRPNAPGYAVPGRRDEGFAAGSGDVSGGGTGGGGSMDDPGTGRPWGAAEPRDGPASTGSAGLSGDPGGPRGTSGMDAGDRSFGSGDELPGERGSDVGSSTDPGSPRSD